MQERPVGTSDSIPGPNRGNLKKEKRKDATIWWPLVGSSHERKLMGIDDFLIAFPPHIEAHYLHGWRKRQDSKIHVSLNAATEPRCQGKVLLKEKLSSAPRA